MVFSLLLLFTCNWLFQVKIVILRRLEKLVLRAFTKSKQFRCGYHTSTGKYIHLDSQV